MLSSASEKFEILVSGEGSEMGRYYMYVHVHCFRDEMLTTGTNSLLKYKF